MPSETSSTTLSCSLLYVLRRSFGRRGRPPANIFKMADFQRPYVWTQENIQKLLDDVDELRARNDGSREDLYDVKNASEYFLGAICVRLVKDEDPPYYEVLDGQQRLTSFLLLAHVLNEQVLLCRSEIIRHRWEKATAKLNEYSDWRKLFVISNPQSKKRVCELYWLFRRDYEGLRLDAEDAPGAVQANGMDIFEQTLYRDVQRFEYLLQKGVFAVLVLEKLSEAEQFFQGENNRGLPMTMLDLLKAYHMRQESDGDRLAEIGRIWRRLGLVREENAAEKKSKSIENVRPSERWRVNDPHWTGWLMTEFVLPAMLMQYGIEPWSASDLKNLPLLKGIVGTHAGDRFIDEKLGRSVEVAQTEPFFDLRSPVKPGLPFFQEVEQYLKLAQAVDVLLYKPENENDRFMWPHVGEVFLQEGLSRDDDLTRILKLAMIAWADRFLKSEIMRSDCTWAEVAAALAADGAFRIYGRNFAHFLDRLKVKGNADDDEKRLGAYCKLRRSTLCYTLHSSEPESNLVFLPHRSSSPEECLRKLKAATHPNAVRFSYSNGKNATFRRGYWNAYAKEYAANLAKGGDHA